MPRISPPIALLIVITILATPALAGTATHADSVTARPPDPRFGAVETFDAPAAASELGAAWTRIPFLWAEMQPNGTHEWLPPISDEDLALEMALGRQPVGLVITTPGWATDTRLGAGVPYGLYAGHNDPENLWASFLRDLVTTYAGRIDDWIIWNEPDVWDATHPGYTWGGSIEDFVQLQRVAYIAIKEANPNARVIFAGTSYWWDAAHGRNLFFRRYLDLLAQDLSAPGNDFYCDAVALHVYFQPDFVYSITALYHQLMREHGFDKPIWIVETNAAPSLDPQMPVKNSQFAITLDEQAAYIVQAFAMAIAGGATRISVFKLIDTPTDLVANPEPFGLIRADGSRRPAFDAYRVAATFMAGFQTGQLDQQSEVTIVTIPRSTGTTTVMWTRTPAAATVEIPAHSSSAALVDIRGNQRTISTSGSVYTVQLPGAICTHGPPCLIGGLPYLVIEGSTSLTGSLSNQSTPLSISTSNENHQKTTGKEIPQDTRALAYSPPTPTPLLEYTINLRFTQIRDALFLWRKHALPGYQIGLVLGPPFHLYRFSIADGKVTKAPRDLSPYTITSLFDWLAGHCYENPSAPACDAQAPTQLSGGWAFPIRIVDGFIRRFIFAGR